MSSYWCELAWCGGEEAEPGVVIETDGERISAVGSSAAPPAGAARLAGLTLPGLANAHSHAFQRAIRGRTQSAGPGDFWSWRERMYAAAERLDPDSYLALARATFAEMAEAGITAVGEFHYLHHGPERSALRGSQRDGEGGDRGGRGRRDPADADRHLLPARRHRARARRVRSCVSPTAAPRPGPSGSSGCSRGPVPGSAPPSTASAPSIRTAAAEVAGWARRAGGSASRPPLRATRRERAVPRASTG